MIGEWRGVTANDGGRVIELQLNANKLSGEIPGELGNLSNLQWLFVQGNQLSGCVPVNLRDQLDLNESDLGELPFCGGGDADTSAAIEADRKSLVTLYNSTNGDNWGNNYNWLSDRPIGEWWGVTTDDSGRVIELVLDFNLLSGMIPAELGSLANLERLELHWNRLTGEIPVQQSNSDKDYGNTGGGTRCLHMRLIPAQAGIQRSTGPSCVGRPLT